ncbi:MAG: cupin domain-containing protein, partial [Gemmatimonadota bacterium]
VLPGLGALPKLAAFPGLGVLPGLAALPRLGAFPRLGALPGLGVLSALIALPAIAGFPAPASAQHDRTIPPAVGGVANADDDARTILQRYVDAWRGAEEMELADTLVVGLRFSGAGGGEYHAVFAPDGSAVLRDGMPGDAVVFHGDMEILRRLDRGELSAMTAMGRAHIRDRTPLDFTLPEGVGYAQMQHLLPWVFHFWNRDWPEVARFGEGTTRFVHGGHSAILYYDLGLRTAFYQVRPGTHINEPEDQQTNPFTSLFIVIRGTFESRLGGEPRTLHEGEAVLVPAGMTHEFWAGADQYGEFIMIAFGEGA